jgi:hypothetical protein
MTKELLRLVSITCSDKRMDIIDTNYMLDTPVNTYKVKCDTCKFPDIDDTPNPYYLAKNRIFTGIEIIEADLGNLLISDRVKKIFEILIPDNCKYQRTFVQNSNIGTDWWLAIPKTKISSGEVNDTVMKCNKCHEPLYAHPGSQYRFWIHDIESQFDIVKSINWFSASNKDWKESWISRDIYLSLRLLTLLNKVSAKGVYKSINSKLKGLIESEKAWVVESLDKIGDLKTNKTRKQITAGDYSKLKEALKIREIKNDRIADFEKKYKRKPTELFQVLCNIEKGIQLDLGNNENFVIQKMDDWESTPSNKKLIGFAQDDFGNTLHFDITNKMCPIYHYDHETMTYDQIHKSILDLIK